MRASRSYMASFPEPVQEVLEEVRRRLLRVVPDAEERSVTRFPRSPRRASLSSLRRWKSPPLALPGPEGDEEPAASLAPDVPARAPSSSGSTSPSRYELIERVAQRLYDERFHRR